MTNPAKQFIDSRLAEIRKQLSTIQHELTSCIEWCQESGMADDPEMSTMLDRVRKAASALEAD